MSKERSLGTVCIQGGWEPKNGEPRQLPIYQSTTFKYSTRRRADIFIPDWLIPPTTQ